MAVIAIDGPSGVGKSSTSKEVARRLGYGYLDTGAMYRATAWLCLNRGVTDPGDVVELVRGAELEISTDPDAFSVEDIREPQVSQNVQTVSGVQDARDELIERQREIIARTTPGIVVEGRDITTVVTPDADVRILMTADESVRIARRSQELHGTADAAALEATRGLVADRDRRDSETTSFLTAADGVHTLDTTNVSFDEAVEAVLTLLEGTSS
jgi:cytidylate kinase